MRFGIVILIIESSLFKNFSEAGDFMIRFKV
jgi:hypothetical protein